MGRLAQPPQAAPWLRASSWLRHASRASALGERQAVGHGPYVVDYLPAQHARRSTSEQGESSVAGDAAKALDARQRG